MGYSPQGHKELDTMDRLSTHKEYADTSSHTTDLFGLQSL